MKVYITFGQAHFHVIAGKKYDRNCVGVLEIESGANKVKEVTEIFGNKWSNVYNKMSKEAMEFYPRGFINL